MVNMATPMFEMVVGDCVGLLMAVKTLPASEIHRSGGCAGPQGQYPARPWYESQAVRCLYVDMDGTLLGPGGGLLAASGGGVSLLGARAIEACLRADVEVVVMSGRRRIVAMEDARLLGQRACIFETGAGIVLDDETHWLTGEWLPGEQTIHAQIAAAGAPGLLLEHYVGRLEEHAPWHTGREVSHLLRGLVDVEEADALLAGAGHGTLRLIDNGVVRRRSPALAALPEVRAYHLRPAGVSKAAAVAAHARMRGLDPAQCAAVGDSREDLAVADVVGAFWLVANAVEHDPAIEALAQARDNVRIAEGSHGEGVYEAVVTMLAERGPA
jgi:hydroxymethylpyrimidine pyrophosphatase-like HAD family hydrolase